MTVRSLTAAKLLRRMSKQSSPPGLYLHMAPATSQSASQQPYSIQNNPVFDKYAEKLQHLRQSDPAMYDERMAKLRELYQPKEKAAPEPVKSPSSTITSEALEVKNSSKPSEASLCSPSMSKAKTLDSIMKLDLLRSKSAEEISDIWFQHHSKQQFVYAVLQKSEYQKTIDRAREFPSFLYPVPKEQGYEFFFQQFNDNSFHFTPLAQYQKHKENAPICLVLEHYTELLEDKGIVLMRGEPNTDILGVEEAQLLAMELQAYYGSRASDQKLQLLRTFNLSPDSFRYEDLLLDLGTLQTGLSDNSSSSTEEKHMS